MISSLKLSTCTASATAAAFPVTEVVESHEANQNGILDLAFTFWYSRVLQTALDLGLFTALSSSKNRRMTSHQLGMTLRFHPGASSDFLDALVSMNFLRRQGTGEEALYSNSEESRLFCSKDSDMYIGDLLQKCDGQYRDWIDLAEILKTKSSKEFKDIGDAMERDIRVAKARVACCHIYESGLNINASLEDIFKVAYGFCPSRILLTMTELGVFTLLANAPEGTMSSQDLAKCLKLDEKRAGKCLSILVGYKILTRKVERKKLVYSNTPAVSAFLDQTKESYIGGVLVLASQRQYQLWADLQETLQSGAPRCGHQESWSTDFYSQTGMCHVLASLEQTHAQSFHDLARAADFSAYKTMVDIGGSTGHLSAAIAMQHKRMRCITADLPDIHPLAEECVRELGMEGRVVSVGMDYMKDEFPRADVIAMSNVLSECSESEKQRLLQKAFEALPKGGMLVVMDCVLDNDRCHNTHGLLKALNMMLERGIEGSYGYSCSELTKWCGSLGYQSTEVLELGHGPQVAFLAYK